MLVREEHKVDEPWSTVLGCPSRVVIEDTFVGEASHRELPTLQRVCESLVGRQGRVEGLIWRPRGFRQLSVSLSPREGRTTLRIEEDVNESATRAYGTIIGLFAIGGLYLRRETDVQTFLGLGSVATMLALTAVAASVLVVCRMLIARYGRRARAEAHRLRDELVKELQGPPGPSPPEAGSPTAKEAA